MKVGQNETLVIKVGVSTAYHKKIKAPYMLLLLVQSA